MIKDGVPYTPGSKHDDNELLTDKDKATQKTVLEWIDKNILPRNSVNRYHTSYRLKHLLEGDTGIYLTNNAFKHAMLLAGYEPMDPDETRWHFSISDKSPALRKHYSDPLYDFYKEKEY